MAMLRTILAPLVCLLAMAGTSPTWGEDSSPLRLAVHPYASTLALINTYRPLQQYLTTALGRPVEFYTAPSFEGFVDTLMAGGYDIVISPPHFAVLAMEKYYVPLVRYQTRLEPLLVVRADSPLHKGEDFRGKRIAMADRTAFIRLVAVKWLADHGARGGTRLQDRGAADSRRLGIGRGDGRSGRGPCHHYGLEAIAGGCAAAGAYDRHRTALPHLFTLAHRRLGEAQIARLKQALLAFPDTEGGRQFMEEGGSRATRRSRPTNLRSLKPYVELYRRMEEGR